MKKLMLIFSLILIFCFSIESQTIIKGSHITYYDSIPSTDPNIWWKSEFAQDTSTSEFWYWSDHTDGIPRWVQLTGGVYSLNYLPDSSGFISYNEIGLPIDTILFKAGGTGSGDPALWEITTGEIQQIDGSNIVNSDNFGGYNIKSKIGLRFTTDYQGIQIGAFKTALPPTSQTVQIGAYSGFNSVDNYNQVSVGYYSSYENQGTHVTAVGSNAAWGNWGDHSTMVGFRSGRSSHGDYLTAIGYRSGRLNDGDSVIAVGYYAGEFNQFNNVALFGPGTVARQNNQIKFDSSYTQARFNAYAFNIDQSIGAAQDGYSLVYNHGLGEFQAELISGGGTGTDDQIIDLFSLDPVTDILSISLEDDGLSPSTVDLSGVYQFNVEGDNNFNMQIDDDELLEIVGEEFIYTVSDASDRLTINLDTAQLLPLTNKPIPLWINSTVEGSIDYTKGLNLEEDDGSVEISYADDGSVHSAYFSVNWTAHPVSWDLTDDQNIQGSNLTGTDLFIGIEDGTGETVDLSSLQGDNYNNWNLQLYQLGSGVAITKNHTVNFYSSDLSVTWGINYDASDSTQNIDATINWDQVIDTILNYADTACCGLQGVTDIGNTTTNDIFIDGEKVATETWVINQGFYNTNLNLTSGNILEITDGNGTLSQSLDKFVDEWILSGDGFGATIGDQDEINIESPDNTIGITYSSSFVNELDFVLAQQGADFGQVLVWNGTQWSPDDIVSTESQDLQDVTDIGNTTTNDIDLNGGFYLLEDGKHGITHNDGQGLFNIRVGNEVDATVEKFTENGYALHEEYNQSTGLWKIESSTVSGTVGGTITWGDVLSFVGGDLFINSEEVATENWVILQGYLLTEVDGVIGNEYNTNFILNGTDLELTDGGGTLTADLSSLVNDGYWTQVNTVDLYNTDLGSIAIGLTDPESEMHVKGSYIMEAENDSLGMFWGHQTNINTSYFAPYTGNGNHDLTKRFRYNHDGIFWQFDTDLRLASVDIDNSLDYVLVRDDVTGEVKRRTVSSLGGFSGLFTDLDFTGTTGFSDLTDDDTQDLSKTGAVISLVNSPSVTLLDDDPLNEFQDLTLTGNLLSLTNSSVDITLATVATTNDYDDLDNKPTLTGYWTQGTGDEIYNTDLDNVGIGLTDPKSTVHAKGGYIMEASGDTKGMFWGHQTNINVSYLTGWTDSGGSILGSRLRYNHTDDFWSFDTKLRVSTMATNTSEKTVLLRGNAGDIEQREAHDVAFSGLHTDLDFTGTTGFSDGVDNNDDTQDLSISGHILSLVDGGSVTLPTSNITTADMAFIYLTDSGTGDINSSSTDNLIPWNIQTHHNFTSVFSHTTATNNSRVEVLEDGNYEFTGSINVSGSTANFRYNGRVKFRINGVTTLNARFSTGYLRNSGGQTETSLTFSNIIPLDANDYVEVLVDRENTVAGAANMIANTSSLQVKLLKSATVTGAGGDNWGAQAIVSSGSLSDGDGTSGDPFEVLAQTLSYNAGTDVLSISEGNNVDLTELTLTKEQVEDFMETSLENGVNSNITITYDDVNNRFNFVVPNAFSGVFTDLDFTGTTGFSDFIDNVDDADASSTNELITDFSLSGTTLTITENGTDWNQSLSSLQDGNNYVNSVSFSGTSTKTITLGREGLSNLSANFTDLVDDADASTTNEAWTLKTNNTSQGIIQTNAVDFLTDNGLQLNFATAGTERNLTFGLIDGTAVDQILKWDGSTWVLGTDNTGGGGSNQTLSYNSTTNQLSISSGNTVTLEDETWKIKLDNAGTQYGVSSNVVDFNSNDGTIFYSISSTGSEWNLNLELDQQGASTGQVLKWDGSSWSPSADGVGDPSSTNEAWIIDADLGTTEVISNQLVQFFGGTDIETTYDATNNRITIDYTGSGGGGSDIDWYEIGTTAAPNAITDEIWTQGEVTIGASNNTIYPLSVYSSTTEGNILHLGRSINNSSEVSILFDHPTGSDWEIGSNSSTGTFSVQNSGNAIPIFTVENTERVGINNTDPDAALHITRGTGTKDLIVQNIINGTSNKTVSEWQTFNDIDNGLLHELNFRYTGSEFPIFPSGTATLTKDAVTFDIRRIYDDSTNVEMVIEVGEYKLPTVGSPHGGYGAERIKFLGRGGIRLFEYSNNGSNFHLFKNNVASRRLYEQEIEGVLSVTQDGDIVPQHINQIYNDAINSTSANTYTLSENHAFVTLTGSANKTVNLPSDADLYAGKVVIIKCNEATQITLDPEVGATIEGSTSNKVISSADPAVAIQLICLGAGDWRIISQYVID